MKNLIVEDPGFYTEPEGSKLKKEPPSELPLVFIIVYRKVWQLFIHATFCCQECNNFSLLNAEESKRRVIVRIFLGLDNFM